jgi:hypothetical protein
MKEPSQSAEEVLEMIKIPHVFINCDSDCDDSRSSELPEGKVDEDCTPVPGLSCWPMCRVRTNT